MWKEKFSKALAKVENGNGEEKPPKRKIENLVVFIIIVIICIFIINNMWTTGDDEKKGTEITETAGRKLAQTQNTQEENSNEEQEMEKNLETILSNMQRSWKSKSYGYLFSN